MAQFKFKSIDERGKVTSGRMHANNVLELEARLTSKTHDVIRIEEVKTRSFRFGRKKLSRKDIINMVFQLEQLIKSGVPLLDGLADLRDSAPDGYYRDLLASLVEGIQGGKTFSESLEAFPQDFDNIFISLIKVGEESGELARILFDMGNTLRWTDELIADTVKILVYPIIVLVIVLAVTAFLMIYLVPKIIPFVAEMGGTVPGYTLALIATSDFIIAYWWALLITPPILIFCIKLSARKNKSVRMNIDGLKLRIPIFGAIMFKIKLARFTNYMALMYAAGMTVIRSLEICRALVSNAVLESAVDDVKNYIIEGKTIGDAFENTGVFPPLVIRMVRVGENTGNLDEALINASTFFSREVKDSIDRIEPTITPILTIVMGVTLGWIMLAVLSPIWEAIGNIGA